MYELALPPELLPHDANNYITLKAFNVRQDAEGQKVYLVRNTIHFSRNELSLYGYTEKVLEDCLDKGFALVEWEAYVRFHPSPHLAFFTLRGQQLVLRTDRRPDKVLLEKHLANRYERRYWGWEETREGPLVWVLVTKVLRKYSTEIRYNGIQYWWQGKQGTGPLALSVLKNLERTGKVHTAIPQLLLEHLKERSS